VGVLLRTPWARLVLVLLGLVALVWCVVQLTPVLTPFAIAFALAYFLNPPVNAMERFFAGDIARSRLLRGRVEPRAAAVGILCLLVVVVLVIVLAIVVPEAWHQASEAVAKLPGYIRTLRSRLEPLYERLNLRYPEQAEQLRERLEAALREHAFQILQPITHGIQLAFTSVKDFLLSVLNFLVVPVFAVYLLYDMNHINAGMRELVPHRHRPYVYSRFAEVDRLLSAFARGQITVCLILGAFYAIGLTACGVPMGLLAGFVIGFFNLVPFMSHVLGLPLALLLSWLDDQSPQRLLAVAAIFVFGQFVEGNFITPRIVGQSLGLHAVIVMLAVLVGGTLFGLVGMLLAVPMTAVLSVFFADLRAWYLQSEFYRSGAAPPPELQA
jgi:predicted PurR-regulated permease PerM